MVLFSNLGACPVEYEAFSSGVKMLSAFFPEDIQRYLHRTGIFIGAFGGEGIKNIRYTDGPSHKGDLFFSRALELSPDIWI